MKLTKAQRAALEWLDQAGPWTTAWWGGKPHTRRPKVLPSQTFDALRNAKLISVTHQKWPDKTVAITPAGKAALHSAAPRRPGSNLTN
jgi:hypothetical protein